MNKLHPFIAGCLGGTSPFLLGFARQALGRADVVGDPLYADPGAWVAAVITGLVCGAFVVYYHKETDTKKAWLLGAAAPGLVMSFFQASPGAVVGDQHQAQAPGQHASAGRLVGTLYAQPRQLAAVREAVAVQVADSLRARVMIVSAVTVNGADLVAVLPASGGPAREVVGHLEGRGGTLSIPRATRELYAVVAGVRSGRVQLPVQAADSIVVQIEVKGRSFGAGFVRAFGVRNDPVQVALRVVAN